MKLLSVMFAMAFALVSCGDDKDTGNGGDSANRAIVEAKVKEDFESQGTIAVSKVVVERGYDIATFTITPATAGSIDTRATTTKNMTAWYQVANATATLKKDVEDLGTTIPPEIKSNFDASKYGNTTLWTVTEVEIDTQHINGTPKEIYEIELENIANRNLEAELYYETQAPYALLYSKEELDDDDDNDEDKVVIDQKLINAVTALYPDPAIVQVIDAEMDGTQVEVEVLVTNDGITTENEIVFTDTTYATVAERESEVKVEYRAISPDGLKTAVEGWFNKNTTKLDDTRPPEATIVEVTTIKTGSVTSEATTYEVEVEYIITNKEYEVELEFNSQFTVTDQEAEINGEDVTFP